MKHPDVPGVVLDAITRRSTPAPGDVHPSVADSPDEDTARYNLGPAPTAAGGVGISKSTPSSPAPAQVSARREVEDSLATAWLVGIVFSGAVFAWLSFGLLGR